MNIQISSIILSVIIYILTIISLTHVYPLHFFHQVCVLCGFSSFSKLYGNIFTINLRVCLFLLDSLHFRFRFALLTNKLVIHCFSFRIGSNGRRNCKLGRLCIFCSWFLINGEGKFLCSISYFTTTQEHLCHL